MISGLRKRSDTIGPDVCPLDPVPAQDEVLVKGRTRLAAMIEDGFSLEINPLTGAVIRSLPLPSNDR